MNKIKCSTSMAPILDGLFLKFLQTGTLDYCIICLRTERRLVKDRAFKKFTASMKLNKKRWQHHQICYMCERQALNALKFLNAATFAAAIDTIFTEIINKKRHRQNVFQTGTFNSILRRCGLDKYKSTNLDWDLDLEEIRKSSQLIETQPLVVDNLNSHMVISAQNSTAPEELYVIPDDVPASLGEFTGLAARHPGAAPAQPGAPPAQPGAPPAQPGAPPAQPGAPPAQPRAPSARPRAPAPPPAITMTDIGDTNDDTFMLGYSDPNISETLVIMDEDEDKDTLKIKIDNVVSNAAVTQSSSQPISSNFLPKPSDPPPALMRGSIGPKGGLKAPTLVPLESLLEKPKEIFTGDGLLVGNPEGNYTLHPIAIKEGITIIPSLNAKLIDGQLVYDKLPQLPLITPVDINQLKNPAELSSKKVNLRNNVFHQISLVNSVQREGNSKTTRRDLPDIAKCATPNKMTKVLPVEEQSELDKSSRIDWEDKIPMDVISYVDAVDPNRDPRMTSKPWSGGKKTFSSLHKSSNVPSASDVIDLC